MFTWVPLSPIIKIFSESSEKQECLFLLGKSTVKCLIGWWECRGEYSMFNFYSRTAKKWPSGLYSTWMIGLSWWEIYWTMLVVSISNTLKIPDLKPAINWRDWGFPEIQVQTSELG